MVWYSRPYNDIMIIDHSIGIWDYHSMGLSFLSLIIIPIMIIIMIILWVYFFPPLRFQMASWDGNCPHRHPSALKSMGKSWNQLWPESPPVGSMMFAGISWENHGKTMGKP